LPRALTLATGALVDAVAGSGPWLALAVASAPTASLDVRGEADFYERFLELTRGATTIVISHRFSTVRRADRIVVLEHGAVIQDGSHDQLIVPAAATPGRTRFRPRASPRAWRKPPEVAMRELLLGLWLVFSISLGANALRSIAALITASGQSIPSAPRLAPVRSRC
jgi:ABC-type multidrug transport system ATPase subunit